MVLKVIEHSPKQDEVARVLDEVKEWGADTVIVLATRQGKRYKTFYTDSNSIELLGALELAKADFIKERE